MRFHHIKGPVCYNERLASSLIRNNMRTLNFASLFTLFAGALLVSFATHAQQPPAPSQDAPPPPKLEKLEEGEAPGVTIREQKGKQTITERRAPDGQVKEVKVTKGKNTYYVKPAPGNALPGDGKTPQSRPAQWQVYEFGKKKKPDESAVDVAPPPPAPAASKPAKK